MRLLGAALLSVTLVAGPAGAGLPTVLHEGRPYVELHQLARAMSARVEATPDASQARLRSPRHTVTFTRNRARVVVDGRAVVLDAPVRVRNGVWLVP